MANANPTQETASSELGTLREILFGKELQSLLASLAKIEARLERIEQNQRAEHQFFEQQLTKTHNDLQAEIGDVDARFSDYRQQDTKQFNSELAAIKTELSHSIQSVGDSLLAHKVDKGDLSTMFNEFAQRLANAQK